MIATVGSNYCCGVVEIGNFNYTATQGPKGFPHYHKHSGTWRAQQKAPPTPEEELHNTLRNVVTFAGAVICTTGADQEYMNPLLKHAGFKGTVFKNRTHEKGEVTFWFLQSEDYIPMKPKTEKEATLTSQSSSTVGSKNSKSK